MVGHKSKDKLDNWQVVDSSYSFRDRWLAVRSDVVILPDGATLSPFHTIECADWVHTIAVDHAQNVILLEQYRHGAKRVLFEFPGGIVDDGEIVEGAARRELLEETGYAGDSWHYLGTVFPASARFTNQSHAFLALGVEEIQLPIASEGEAHHVCKIPWKDFTNSLRSGRLDFAEAPQLASLLKLQFYIERNPGLSIEQLTL